MQMLQRLYGFSQIVHGIELHKFVAILSVIVLMGMMYLLSIPIERQSSADLPGSSHGLRSLTRIDDPQYADEYSKRVHAINAGLERLRDVTQSDRTYLVVYNYDSFQPEIPGKIRISQTFEIGQKGFPYQLSDFQHFPREEWVRMKQGERRLHWFGSSLLLRNYGLELTNDQDIAIGYVGFDYLQTPPGVRNDDLAFLKHTAMVLTAGLSEPLESLDKLE
jgi:hypothetical protein